MQADINGTRLSWAEAGAAGSNRALLLVHGFPFSSAMWKPQLDAPPLGWRVIAPDLRGFGASEGGSIGQSMDTYAQDIAGLMTHLGITNAVLGGLSMGGYIVFAFLRRYAARVRALVLADTRAGADTEEASMARKTLAVRVRQEGIKPVVDSMLPKLLLRTARGTAVEQRVREMMESTNPETAVAALLAMAARPDSTPHLRSVNVPTQVIVGAEDQITPPGEARLIARAVPSALIEVIPDAGHLPNLEQPRVFNDVLGRFLEGLP